MAVQSSFYVPDGSTRTFPSTKHIATKQHVGVYLQRALDSAWETALSTSYELVNNSIVFDSAVDNVLYIQIEIRVVDTTAELIDSPSNIALVAASIADVNTVADSILDVNIVADNISSVQNTSAISANITTVAGISTNVTTVAGVSTSIPTVAGISANVTTVAGVSGNVTTVASDIANVNTAATNIDDINSVATTIVPNIAEILLADDNATTATTQAEIATTQATSASSSATQAQLYEWETEAERLTADSYATEAEDVFVKLVTSDGDGTFTYTPTTDYSALHWAAKSMAGDIAPIIHAATAKTTPVDADEFAIADSVATFGLKKVTWANIKTALTSLFAPIASPSFTGTPTAPTAPAGTNTTQLATTAFVLANSMAIATKATYTSILVDGVELTIPAPALIAGKDLYFSKTEITTVQYANTIGGFHYSLVPHAEAATGNKTEADMVKLRGINAYSIWTLWDRPICPDPRGKAKVGSRWYDIYLMDRDYAIRGYSAPTVHTGANIAAGGADATYLRQIPKIPLAYGGDGTVTYGKYTWFQACEVATATGNQNISYNEFPTIAYGVLEGVSSSAYGDNGTIFHIPQLMSKYGIEMATGTEWIWGADVFSDTSGTYVWQNVADSRGQIYSVGSNPKAVVLGGYRASGVVAGSRASEWHCSVGYSFWDVGSRFACDCIRK